MKKCPFCNQELPDSATVCQSCNRELPAAAASAQQVAGQTSRMAIVSLGFGSLAGVMLLTDLLLPEPIGIFLPVPIDFFFVFLFPAAALVAVVCGHLGRREVRRSAGSLKGGVEAAIGLALGYTFLIALFLGLVILNSRSG